MIQTAYTIGPFNLAPMGQSGSESQSFQGTIPRPTGAFGLKSITFDLVGWPATRSGTVTCTCTTWC